MSVGGSATQTTTLDTARLDLMIAGGIDIDAVAAAGVDIFFFLLAGGHASASGEASANARYTFASSLGEEYRPYPSPHQ